MPENQDEWPDNLHETIKVECTSIDHYIKTNNINKIDLLKIDVDGADFDVLMGAKNLLSSDNPLFVIFESSMYWKKTGK